MAKKPEPMQQKDGLSAKVERTNVKSQSRGRKTDDQELDRVDGELASYIEAFVEDFTNQPPLPEINLLSQEGATNALEVIERTQARLDAHMKTIAALRTLLNQS